MNKICDGISLQTLKRLPEYLNYLERKQNEGVEFISMPCIAKSFKLSEILVKKDFSVVTSKHGKPKVGHSISGLINDIKDFLGYNEIKKAAIAGIGKLGGAILEYEGFKKNNIEITVGFDINENEVNREINGIKILPVSKLTNLCQRMKVNIGIITTDVANAQEVCDMFVASGVKGIWNFAPTILNVPDNVIVQNEFITNGLIVLIKKIELQNKKMVNKGDK